VAKRLKKSRTARQGRVSPRQLRQRKITRASRESDASIQRLADEIPAAIFIFQGTKNRLVNPAAEALTGYSRKELLKLEFWQILHPEFRELVKERGLRRQKGASVPPRYEVKIIRKDGEERWLDYTGGTIKFHGEIAVIGTAIDITERKRAEEHAQRNLGRIRALYEVNLAATSTLDLKSVLNVVLDGIDRFLPCPIIGAVRVTNPQTGSLRALAVRNFSDAEWEKAVPLSGRGLTKAVLESRQVVLALDAAADPRCRHPEVLRKYGLVSYLGAPLIINDNVLGNISLYTKKKYHFSDEEVDFISTLAAQAATAIHNSKLYEEMEWKTKEVSALNILTAATTQSLDLNSVAQETVRSIVNLFQFEGAWIYLFNESLDEVHLRASFQVESGQISPVQVIRTGEGVVGSVLKTGEMVILEDIQGDPRYEQLSQSHGAKKAGARFFAALPIQSKLKFWGVLACIGNESKRLGIEEIDLLVTLCNQVAISIENATLFQQTAQKAKELSALYSIAGIAAEFVDINTLLYQSMRKVLDIFGFTAVRIYIVDDKNEEIRLAAQDGFPADIHFPRSYRLGEGLMGKVVETGLPLTFEDMQNDSEYYQHARAKIMLQAGFRASFFIPLRVRGKTLGVMNLVSKEPHTFSPSDIQLINSIAYHLGIAIGNASIFSQLTRRTLDLEKANKAKDEFLSVVSHELRTPVSVILGFTQLILDGTLGDLPVDLQDAIAKIAIQTKSLLSMVEEILVTTRIEAGVVKLELKEINVADFFATLKSSYDLPWRADFQLVWDIPSGLPPLTIDAAKLKHIVQNLIDNALKFTKNGQVMVSARNVPETKTMSVSVKDTGIGIKLDEIPGIFEMFHQVDSSETRDFGGVGLGLYIVKKFTDMLHGTVKVESEFGKGSTFTVAIPWNI
jgi:PAS domain S-box-containing protein